ncbi:MAG: hypothetical protein IJV08_05135 [Bacteroidaceae bacterium]|nr:hypothetical protein [Bacteroidaceae bacterium]
MAKIKKTLFSAFLHFCNKKFSAVGGATFFGLRGQGGAFPLLRFARFLFFSYLCREYL